nr:hypothetical protein [Tanacetum cinerariifolium]
MIAILEKYEHNQDFNQIVDFVKASHIRYALTFNPTVYVSHIRQFWSTARFETTEEGTKILVTVDGKIRTVSESSIRRNLKLNDEAGINEHASPLGDDSQGEACPTNSGLEAYQNRANITKTSTLPSDSTPRVTSLATDEGSMQYKLTELMDLCTRLQRHQAKMASKINAQELEISQLKARVRLLEDKEGGGIAQSGEDAPIKGMSLDKGEATVAEKSTKRGSDDTKEIVIVLTSLDAAKILTSRGVQVSISPATEFVTATVSIPTGSGSIPTASPPCTGVLTGSDVVPTDSLIFTTATESTPYTRRKGKENMVESDTPKKNKLQEQIDVQVARELEKEMAKDAQRMNEQIARDVEIARIHAKEELQMVIDGLDKNNETVASSQVQTQQRKPLSRKQQKDFYMSVLRSHAGWKAKHFKGMTLEEIKEKFDPVWKQMKDFIPIGSKEESERFKRKGLRLEQDSAKKLKTSEEVPEEKLKEMMELIPVEEALVKETLNIRPAANDKENDLWVELKILYEPDVKDLLWTHTQNLMHALVEWKLYNTCGVHHVISKDQEMFMLVDKDYPLRKDMFRVNELEGNEVILDVREKIIEKEVSTADPVTTAGEVVTAASVEDSVAPTTTAIADVDDELTLAKTLIAIKAAKPKVISTAATTVTTAITTPRAKCIIFYEQVKGHIPTISSSKDKGKAKMIEPEKPLKKKDQIALDEEVARKLEAKMKDVMEEEEKIAMEKDETNRVVIEEWDDVQAIIDADRQLAEQIQAQEKEHLSSEERSKLLAKLIESRRKYFAAKRAEEIKNKPPIKSQQKSLMSKAYNHVDEVNTVNDGMDYGLGTANVTSTLESLGNNFGKEIDGLNLSPTGPTLLGPTSFAKLVTHEPSGKSVNLRTLITPVRNEADLAVPLKSIRATSEWLMVSS